MKKSNDFTVSELRVALNDFFDEESIDEIFNLYTHHEIIDILHQEREDFSGIDSATHKHIPTRKKKANRSKSFSTQEYKKQKAKKWIEKRRKDTKPDEVTNRSYLNKASKGYTKLHPHVKPKSK